MIIITTKGNVVICILFGFVSASLSTYVRLPSRPMARTGAPKIMALQSRHGVDLDVLGLICSSWKGLIQPHLPSHCPTISVKDHHPSEVRTTLRVSSPSPLVNLTGAARSGFWAFKYPTGVFVFEWTMIPMNGGEPPAVTASL